MIDAVIDEIRLPSTLSLTGVEAVITSNVLIIGGFDDCAAADPTPDVLTVLDGSGGAATSVIEVQSGVTAVLAHLRISNLHVVDEQGVFIGSVRLQDLALAAPEQRLGELITTTPASVQAMAPTVEVVELLEQRRLASVPVVDFDGHLVGVIRHDGLLSAVEAEAAVAVARADHKVDLKYHAITRQLMTYMAQDHGSIPQVLNVLWAARALERIGDRCQNIAEYVIYLVIGKDVRHVSLDDVMAELEQRADSEAAAG